MGDVALSAGIRANLFSLQKTDKLLQRTNDRLASGRKVSSPLDNPTAYFQAANLNDRASNLSRRLDAMGQAISTLETADAGVKAMRSLIGAMKGKVDEAFGQTQSSVRIAIGKQFNELLVQVQYVAKDASYQGVNLLQNSETLTVQFSENYNQSTLTIQGFDVQGPNDTNSSGWAINSDDTASAVALQVTSAGETTTIRSAVFETGTTFTATGTAGTAYNWADSANYKTMLSNLSQEIEEYDEVLIAESKSLNTSLTIITIREEFAKDEINLFEGGADKLTLADLNEEGANLLALQTAQTLGIQALALASRTSQAILNLIG